MVLKQINNTKNILGLSLSLAKANFKLKNGNSYLGIFWHLLEPLAIFFIIILVKGMFTIQTTKAYPLYLLIGLIMFNFFSKSTSLASLSITSNDVFIKSTKIPLESLVISKVLQVSFSHFFEIIIFVIFMLIFNINPINMVLYFLIFSLFFIFVLGVSFILAIINVYLADFSNIWNIFLKLLWFSTPIFYTLKENSLIYKISLFNPLYHFLNIAREIIIYNKIPGISSVLIISIISVSFLIFGFLIFNKYKYNCAENV